MSTLMPFCNMGVITMKMISSTSITSTMGVTLMSELTLAPTFLFASAIDESPEQWPVASGRKTLRKPCAELNFSAGQQLVRTNQQLGPANVATLQEVVDQFA